MQLTSTFSGKALDVDTESGVEMWHGGLVSMFFTGQEISLFAALHSMCEKLLTSPRRLLLC